MHVSHLSLVDFRSYPTAEIALAPGVTTLLGRNGQGKTNLVEALGYAATLGSHRVPSDAPLVRAGAERAVVRVAVERGGRTTLVELEIVPGRANRARVNRAPVPRPREVLGLLRTVLFAPEDLALVKGEPEGRRRLLDDLLVQLAPRLAGVRADLDRVLRQRNALLKQAGPARGSRRRRSGGEEDDLALPTLEVWDAQLARLGAELLHARRHLVARLSGPVRSAYAEVSGEAGRQDGEGTGGVRLGYRSTLAAADAPPTTAPDGPGPAVPGREELATALLDALREARPAELERGVSLVGPHRDDLVLELGGLPARGYASHGESWSVALALRLGAFALLGADEQDGGQPVLVLDDVFAELDSGRRQRLAALVGGAEQVLVTAAVEEDVPAALVGDRLLVRDGEVVRA